MYSLYCSIIIYKPILANTKQKVKIQTRQESYHKCVQNQWWRCIYKLTMSFAFVTFFFLFQHLSFIQSVFCLNKMILHSSYWWNVILCSKFFIYCNEYYELIRMIRSMFWNVINAYYSYCPMLFGLKKSTIKEKFYLKFRTVIIKKLSSLTMYKIDFSQSKLK